MNLNLVSLKVFYTLTFYVYKYKLAINLIHINIHKVTTINLNNS